MRHDLKVSRNDLGELVVDPDPLYIDQQAGAQLLVWTLDDATLPNAKFVESTGLQWRPPEPPWHVFRRHTLSVDGRTLSVLDRNEDVNTGGGFEYHLNVVETDPHGSSVRSSSGVRGAPGSRPITNPIIINR
jgi:hypothetical protein